MEQNILLNSIRFANQNTGWVAGFNGKIMKTTNGGTDWISQSTRTNYELKSIDFIDENIGWTVGDNGTILKTTNGGVTFIEDENNAVQPGQFLLHQNYPNPFNPTTKIRYAIPSNVKRETGNVLLKVYDILGNEIETLVNEEKSPGTYEVAWNAVGLPSGVYFYQLRVGSFIETRKMVLLR